MQAADKTHVAPDIPMTVVLLLTNFVLTWIEVWLMDFKVLPTEFKMANSEYCLMGIFVVGL